ncbi:C39 family peptidase [Aminipila sp.]|uniref:C39 family peptidase n=1 Tax=Aminipila sp. TaxID=2060095 RepID=UPI00289E3151|nr:C39 family peptidase [Aminipila sp.]
MKRKVFCIIMSICIIYSQGLSVFASNYGDNLSEQGYDTETIKSNDNPSFIDGDSGEVSDNYIDLDNIDKEIQAVVNDNSLSKAEKNAKIEKLSIFKNMDKSLKSTRGTDKSSAKLKVSVSTQETGYYCGPATVKQTLTYINGKADSQSSIAKAIGTTTDGSALINMVGYVNEKKQAYVGYEIVQDPNIAEIQTCINYSCNIGNPIMCRLKFSKGGDWAYSTSGHYMNANGYKDYGGYIYVTDPNIKRVDPSSNGSYYVHVNSLYYATHNHFAQEMAV